MRTERLPAPIRSLLRLDAALALVACALFAWAWGAAFPRHEGVPIAVTLSPLPPAAAAGLPEWRIEATVASEVVNDVVAQVVYAFSWDEPGRYTLYGISSFDDVAPLAVSVNDVPVAAMAFSRDTGSRRANFERHRIAGGIALRRGRNHVTLEGPWLLQRSIALEWRREAPPGPARWLALFAAAAGALAVRAWVVRRVAPSPGGALAATGACFALFLTAPLALAAACDGRGIADLDQSDRRKRARLDELEAYLRSPDRARGAYQVALLGDSTHFWPRPKRERMLPVLRDALLARGAADVEVYGISAGAFSSYDFYLLLNRLVEEAPDLVIVPVNLRSFGDAWNALLDHDFPRIERYLRLSELPRAHGLALGARELRWDALLRLHLDLWLADGRVGAFLRGLERRTHAERDRILAGLAASPDARHADATGGDPASPWPSDVPPDHPTLQPFRLLNGLAARRGIAILYYTVQANERAQAARGVDLALHRQYGRIAEEIGRAPGVAFLDLSGRNPPWMFADENEHLSREGMRAVAERLADAIVQLRDTGR